MLDVGDKQLRESTVIAYGQKNNFGDDDREVKAYYCKPVTERGNLFITGVSFSFNGQRKGTYPNIFRTSHVVSVRWFLLS